MRDCKDCIHYKVCCEWYGAEDHMPNLIEYIGCSQYEEEHRGNWHEFATSQFIGHDDYGNPKYRDGAVYRHDECGFNSIIKHNYCPRCGAKMEVLNNEID